MRFGISATSWIFPKNFLTRLRPVNVCAIVLSLLSSSVSSLGTGTTLQKAAIHRDYLDRRTDARLRGDSVSRTAGLHPAAKSLPSRGLSNDRPKAVSFSNQPSFYRPCCVPAERQTR